MTPWLRRAAAAIVAATLASAAAHATLVFGVIRLDPDPPPAGAPFRVEITLEDPSLAPVEDAVVFVELRPMPEGDLPPAATAAPDLPPPLQAIRLLETGPASYRGELGVPAPGRYHLLVRDQTFAWEEANASVVLAVGAAPVGDLPFILPPTQVAPRSLWTWILWLVGLPLAAGAVVTVLVLRSGRAPAGRA